MRLTSFQEGALSALKAIDEAITKQIETQGEVPVDAIRHLVKTTIAFYEAFDDDAPSLRLLESS